MSPHPSQNQPWPAPTQAPHRHSRRIHSNSKRDEITDLPQIEQAKHQCQFQSGNDVWTCFPTNTTIVPQHQWAGIVWNSRQPDLRYTNLVNLYLFHADSQELVLQATNRTNPTADAGYYSALVDDRWFGSSGSQWNGANISRSYYWIVKRNDQALDGSETTQAIFTAVQTTYADSVLASMASTASVASASSASAASLSSAHAAASSNSPNVQSGASSSSFPHWAIAVIVVLGFLAIASTCVLAFCIIGRMRRRNNSHRSSLASESPMMANAAQSAGSPLLAGAAERHSSIGHHPPSVVSPDGASTISRVGSLGDSGPFSGADAAIMADAFRKALRKPDFAGHPVEEGESPDNPENENPEDLLLNQHLAEEGRDIRSVSSSRGVRVETLSDSGETAHENPH